MKQGKRECEKWCCHYQTPIGIICIEEDGEAVTSLHLDPGGSGQDYETPLLYRTFKELMEYFERKRRVFDIPVKAEGTKFQMAVWKALQEIPYGETRSYAQIAAALGRPKACRAVGGANHRNPVMILIPCHRVIGADGSLVGFGGGIEVKEKLLYLEQQESSAGRSSALLL